MTTTENNGISPEEIKAYKEVLKLLGDDVDTSSVIEPKPVTLNRKQRRKLKALERKNNEPQ